MPSMTGYSFGDVVLLSFPFTDQSALQGHAHTWHCGHTVANSQEHGFISGLAVAGQLGAGYAFEDAGAREWFNFWGRGMFGPSFREVREGERVARVHGKRGRDCRLIAPHIAPAVPRRWRL